MGNAPQEGRSDGLDARLRALRRAHPTLAVLTEIVHLDERRVTFRATVRIDGETRAQGHAAQGGDAEGAFVAAAERLAVEQALLLGGFGINEDESPTPTGRARGIPTPPVAQATPPEGGVVAADSPAAPALRRRMDQSARPPTPARGERNSASRDPASTPEDTGTDSDQVPTASPSPPSAAAAATTATAAPVGIVTDAAEPGERVDPGASQASRGDTVASGAGAVPTTPAAIRAATGDGPTAERISDPPAAPRATTPRRTRTRTTVAAPHVAPLPEAQATQATVRAAWRVGRPIPAWWPPDRVAVGKRLPRAQVERLRAVALDEEMTATQLDTYSTLLFGSVVAGLSQAQGAILEERLNPAYPSPLEELRARRVLYPLAVGDTVEVPTEQSAFIRWRDVPTVEETPLAPAPPSWRAGGGKGSGTRRR